MFAIMDEFSPWPPVNCNDCRNVSCTEAEQEKAMGKPPHICREYKKRVFHGTNKRGFHSCLHPCVDCIKDRFRKFESRGENVMTINVSDLPPKYQAQAMKKYMEQQKQRRVKAEKPPASPQCTDCQLWEYGAVSCARFNLRYALNEMLKELPFFCRTAEGKIVCPHKEAKK